MADYIIPDSDKIRSYVTWPETEQIFDDGRGGLAFPEQNNSGCTDGTDASPVSIELVTDVADKTLDENPVTKSDVKLTITQYNVDIKPDELPLVCSSFTYDHVHNTGTLTFSEDVLANVLPYISQDASAKLVANTADTLECTKIVSDEDNINYQISGNMVSFRFIDDAHTPTEYIWNRELSVSIVLHLNLSDNDGFYAYFSKQDNPDENGVYLYTAGSVVRVAGYPVPDADEETTPLVNPTVNDNVPCCNHYRKSYSHREVHDRADSNIGAVTGFGVKSFASIDCDGGFIDWFTTNGSVNIGNGHESVYVQGFGLGEMYRSQAVRSEQEDPLPKDAYDENDGTLHPLMTWAYGTRFDSRTPTNLPALPRDWPFTNMVGTDDKPVFNRLTDTNNITLVKKCSAGVGNLERDITDDANPGNPDERKTFHVFNNRHHIVLYPEYSAIRSSDSYKTDSVIVKPLFIHLPATLDTKDGETVDITVSIQNVDQTAFGTANTEAALSGYKAAVSQPRVYVLGGVQKFSNKKLSIDTDSVVPTEDGYTISSSQPAYDKDGKLLSDGTEIRANVVVGTTMSIITTRSFVVHGTIASNDENGLTITASGTFPLDIGGRGWNDVTLTICGIAYLDADDNPTDTPMGLYYRKDGFLAGDMGDNSKPLNKFNKFYSRHNGDEADGKTVLPFMDKRYVLATVYQSATSTFPWAITHRRKLATLTRSWTDELYRDNRSHKALMHMVYEENAKLHEIMHDKAIELNIDERDRIISAAISPISYMAHKKTEFVWNSLGSVIRVVFPGNVLLPAETEPYGNPVRQAQKAVHELASDFYKMRLLSYVNRQHARVSVTGWDLGERTDWTSNINCTIEPPTYNSNNNEWTTALLQSAWCCTARSLPKYVLATDFCQSAMRAEYPPEDYKTALDSLFTTPDTFHIWYNYLHEADFPYNVNADPKEASACTDESGVLTGEPVTVAGKPTVYNVFSDNSVILHYNKRMVFSKSEEAKAFEFDARRYAETVLGIKIPEDVYMDLSRIKYVTSNNQDLVDIVGIKDWMNPFTNIHSVDVVPVPVIDSYDTLADVPDEFIESDPVALYRTKVTDSVPDISTIMPTDDDMAKFLESYVAAYAADMPKHLYQGTRILCKDGIIPSGTDTIYVRAIERVKKRMFPEGTEEDPAFIRHYINDNFAYIEASTRDPNVDRAIVGKPSINVASPPYEPSVDFGNQTYTRVIMQFTFSQKAGRWYTTGYRQYPTNYLSPLYGADALGTVWKSQFDSMGTDCITYDKDTKTISDGHVTLRPLWRNSACAGFNNYRSHMYVPYSMIPPMDITLGCVPYLTGSDVAYRLDDTDEKEWEVLRPGETVGPGRVSDEYNGNFDDSTEFQPLTRLENPYMPESAGGINLYPPSDINGGHSDATDDGIHANFWSVHRFIRPAVSVLPGTDVPSSDPYNQHTGGLLSDPTLYRMFDFPYAGTTEYVLPDTVNPDDDNANPYLIYHIPNGSPEEDAIAGGTGTPGSFVLAYGVSELEQNLNGN